MSHPPNGQILATAAALSLVGLAYVAGGVLTAFGAVLLWTSSPGTDKSGLRRGLCFLALAGLLGVATTLLGPILKSSGGFVGPGLSAGLAALQLLGSTALVPLALGIVRMMAQQLTVPTVAERAAWCERTAFLAASICIGLGVFRIVAELVQGRVSDWLIGAASLVWLLPAAVLLLLVFPLARMLSSLSRLLDRQGRLLATVGQPGESA